MEKVLLITLQSWGWLVIMLDALQKIKLETFGSALWQALVATTGKHLLIILLPKVWLIMRVQPVYPAGPARPCFTAELEERADGKLEDPFAFSRVRIKIDPVRGAKRAKG